MIKPEFFDSESLAYCSIEARLAFIGLWVTSDDYGNQKAQFSRLKHRIFPYDNMSVAAFADLLCELEDVGCIKGYEIDGDRYITVPNFNAYQTVRKPSKTNVPEPPESVLRTRTTSVIREWFTSGAMVSQEYRTSDGVRHQCVTSDTERKKEGKKEVVVLQQQLPKECGSDVAAAAKAAPPSPPKCPMCGTEVERTGMPDPDAWWCPNCKDNFAYGKVVA